MTSDSIHDWLDHPLVNFCAKQTNGDPLALLCSLQEHLTVLESQFPDNWTLREILTVFAGRGKPETPMMAHADAVLAGAAREDLGVNQRYYHLLREWMHKPSAEAFDCALMHARGIPTTEIARRLNIKLRMVQFGIRKVHYYSSRMIPAEARLSVVA